MYEFHLISPSSFCRTVINMCIYIYTYQQNYFVYLEIDQLLLLNMSTLGMEDEKNSRLKTSGNKTPPEHLRNCSNVSNHPFISVPCCVHSEDIRPENVPPDKSAATCILPGANLTGL